MAKTDKELEEEIDDQDEADASPSDDNSAPEEDTADEVSAEEPPSHKDPEEMESEDLGKLPKRSDEPDDTEKEYDASEEIGKQEAGPEPQVEISPDIIKSLGPSQSNPQLSKFQDYMAQYRKLQDQQRKGDLVNGLIAAGGKIGQSMAGKYSGNFVPDQTGNQMLERMNQRPLQNFEQGLAVEKAGMGLNAETAAMDPSSPQSKMVRDYLNKRMFADNPLPDTVSAADAQMLLKATGRPLQTKFQKVNGTWTDPVTNEPKRMSAVFDPGTGTYKDADTGKALPGFLAEGLNPFSTVVNPNTGQKELFNKSRGTTSNMATGQAPVGKASTPQEVNASLDPVTRKELNDKVGPAFNKETEKIQQRLNHVDVIMQRLQEAQNNPAALPQLKAEMARFDVGDQRLAQQELEMFAKRQGYKGIGDWVQSHTEGTISPDFANDMGQAISHVSQNLKGQLSESAEKHAKLLSNRMPPGQKVDPKLIAPLIYGAYKPAAQAGKQVIKKGYNPQSDKTQLIYSDGTKEIVDGRQ